MTLRRTKRKQRSPDVGLILQSKQLQRELEEERQIRVELEMQISEMSAIADEPPSPRQSAADAAAFGLLPSVSRSADLSGPISLEGARKLLDSLEPDAGGMVDRAEIVEALGRWRTGERAWESGSHTTDGWIDLPASGRRVRIVQWAPGYQWSQLWQRLGAAQLTDALATLGALTRGNPLCLLSTRARSPGKEW